MPEIHFAKPEKYPTLSVEPGEALMWALMKNKIPVASACHGKAVCSKCKIKIVEGANNLNAETQAEIELREKNNISSDFRISCQTKILQGSVTVDTDYW